MNLILFEEGELAGDRLELRDRRLLHLQRVLHARAGQQLRVGMLDGPLGVADIEAIDNERATLRVRLSGTPPAALPFTVILALPRPKMLRRILRAVAELGVKDLHLVNSAQVDKSYWQSPLLDPSRLREYLISGLEQASDTTLPTVRLHQRFRPFAEDSLPALCAGRRALLAQPGAALPCPADLPGPGLLTIGPERGFIPFERELLAAAGCEPVNLGARTLRVETALQCALGRQLCREQPPVP